MNNPFADDYEEEQKPQFSQPIVPNVSNVKPKAKEDMQQLAGNMSYPSNNTQNTKASIFF